MADFSVYILGCGSALPTNRHLPACQVVNLCGRLLMIDCGEGAQLQFRRMKLNFNRLTDIFITHLHGDHCFGLLGLISSMGLLGRTRPLRVHGPKSLSDFLSPMLLQFCADNPYTIEICTHATDRSSVIIDDTDVTVHTIPLRHRIDCAGYVFEEKCRPRRLIHKCLDEHEVPHQERREIVHGADYIKPDGSRICNADLSLPAEPPKRYAYCSDTAFDPTIVPYIAGVDLLYHEATFGSELQDRAFTTMHSTAAEAAQIALMARVKKLLIGHYSSRYRSEEMLLAEAKFVFSNTELTNEGMKINL